MKRARRSALYMPGSNARALAKARNLAADVLIFDLEDAVAPEAKAGARDNIATAMAAGGYGNREVVLRINAGDTAWHEADLDLALAYPFAAVLVPKAESSDAVRSLLDKLDGARQPNNLAI